MFDKCITMKQNVAFSFNEEVNYKTELDATTNVILRKYTELLVEYIRFIVGHVKINNMNHLKFIITRGLDTVTNVFNNVLYYTKNIDVTYHHSQKAFYFYIEFISQIKEADKLFLQLSSRDASMYVYKKTIFDINTKYAKPCSNKSMDDFKVVTENIDLYKVIMLKIIQGQIQKTKLEQFEEIISKLMKIDNAATKKISNIIDILYNKIQNTDKFLEIVFLLINKVIKNSATLLKIENNILNDELEQKINEISSIKFVEWLAS
jgi:hypothetical protein